MMTVELTHVVVLAHDDVKVVAAIPGNKTEAEARLIASQIHDDGVARGERHYDRYARGDYDLVGFFRRQLVNAGFPIVAWTGPDL